MSSTTPYNFDYGYYDYPGHSHSTDDDDLISSVPSWLSLARIILVILLRIGFVLIHVGSVPVNNVNLILLQNIVDFCWVTIIYGVVGIIIAYTGDLHGLIGEGYWIGDNAVDKDEAIIGWSAVVIAAAICTCGIVGRMHTVGYLIVGLLLAGLIEPFLIHWIWTPKGWMRANTLNKKNVKFYDYSGSTIVHVVGGLSGLIGCMVLGRRILRLDAIDDASIAIGSSGTVFAGQMFVFIGLQSLSMPNFQLEKLEARSKNRYNVYINNLLAASSCSLLVVFIHFLLPREEFNHWTVMRCVQAMVAGMVIISAGADVYPPLAAIILGSIAIIIFYLISRQVFHSALEDYCNFVAIHLVCALLGSILVPFFSHREDDSIGLILFNSAWQLICLIAIIVIVAIIMYLTFAILQLSGLLRNRSEYLNHLRASIAAERTPDRRIMSFFDRLFREDRNPMYLQPESNFGETLNTGTRGRRYQREDLNEEQPRPGGAEV